MYVNIIRIHISAIYLMCLISIGINVGINLHSHTHMKERYTLAKHVKILDRNKRILIILAIAVQSQPITSETHAYAAPIIY